RTGLTRAGRSTRGKRPGNRRDGSSGPFRKEAGDASCAVRGTAARAAAGTGPGNKKPRQPGGGWRGRGTAAWGGAPVPVDLLQGKGEIRDRRCTCRGLCNHGQHWYFVKKRYWNRFCLIRIQWPETVSE